MAQTKPKAGQFYGVSDNGTDGQFLKTDGTGGMSWDSPITNPTITSIDYPGSQTAADPAGGESVIINGTLFASGITCTVGGTSAVTAFNSATQITITTPAKAAGQYTVAVINPDGGAASLANFIQYSGVPVWSTASGSLGSVQEGASASFQVTATEGSDTIEYAVTTGTLPTGLSLNTNTGAITGTAPSVSADTTTTFSITATDDENQTSSERSFSITVTNDNPSNHFNVSIYNGSGASQSITTGFATDFTWIKSRSNATWHEVHDVVRGNLSRIFPNDSSQELTSANGFASLNSNGFSLDATGGGGDVNTSGRTYVAWSLKAGGAAVANTDGTIASQVSVNNTLGFSIVKYDGAGLSGSASTVGHGLDAAPELMFVKVYEQGLTATSWFTYSVTAGNAKEGYLNSSSAFLSDANRWNSTSPTSTVFTLGSSFSSYPSYYGGDTIAYCFTSKPGFSKIGTYAGNGTTSHLIQTGFKPAFLMIKSYTDGGGWVMIDDKRNPSNPVDNVLYAEASTAESVNDTYVQANFLTNGFELLTNDSGINMSGRSYIYLAFAADPSTTTPSLANSFGADLYIGNNTTNVINTVGFKPDLTWVKARNDSKNHVLVDSVRGTSSVLEADTTAGAVTGTDFTSFDTNGFTLAATNAVYMNPAGINMVSWNWKAGGLASINTDGTITSLVSANDAAGFSVVEYRTSGVQSIGHGLSSAPELVIQKSLDVSGGSYWAVYSAVSGMGTGKLLRLNETSSVFTDSYFFSAVGNSTFTTSWSNTVYTYINYCFRSITGYSKVGSYTGNAGSNPISVGFQPGFVMAKQITGSGGSWLMMDSARGANNQLYANLPSTEYTDTGNSFSSTGFTMKSNGNWNASGETYIYLAIKEN